jgi:CheY-like chemotaxis protein
MLLGNQDGPMSHGHFDVLLVEDDDLDVMNARRVLGKDPAVSRLLVAHDGVEALELLRSGQVRLAQLVILADLRMPRMSGLELVAELRRTPALHRIPVVVLTTSADDGDRATAYAHNVAGYLLKPLSFSAFREQMGVFSAYWASVHFPG